VPEIEDAGDYDVIVIGAGMAGLMAANALVLRGHRVLLLEKHALAGGCTMNFEREGFRFEASTHVINGCEAGGMTYEELAKIDAQDRIEFIKVESFGRMVDETRGREFALPWELGEYVEMLAEQFPHEEPGIRAFYGNYGPMAETLLGALGTIDEDDADGLAKIGVAGQAFTELSGRKAVEVLSEYISDSELIELMLAIPSGFMGTNHHEIDAGSAIMCDLIFRVNGGDAYYPKGGSGHMSQVLSDLFVERGGTLLLNRGVSEIRIENGIATQVLAKKRAGHFISASARCIVAASDLTTLVNDLCPKQTFPSDYVRSINERKPSISAAILFVGLDVDLRERGITEVELSHTWATGEVPSAFGEIARECDFAKLPNAMATIYSNIDPSCCPAGKSVVATMGLAEPDLFEAALGAGRQRGRAYKKLKERITEQLIEKLARVLDFPDIADHIEHLELATPVTIQRDTENRAGAYVGWRYSASQALDLIPQQSPVENLILCGQWVAPGGGVSNVMRGGNNAAAIASDYLRGLQ
jgi:phytoene dehydrogenase-like protein